MRKPGITAARERAADLAAQGLKECTGCGTVSPIEKFRVRRASKDGRAYRCNGCLNAHAEAWRRANPDAFRLWRADKKNILNRRFREWRKNNIEHRARYNAAWSKANPEKVNALIAKRNAIKKNALAPWADMDAIRAIYAEARRLTKETGVRHEVDHIYPLQSDVVCGLHVENNLQILTKTENIRKKNRMPAEYEEMMQARSAELSS